MVNTLNVAASGLAVAGEQVENVMNNIANENTPGYKKRVVDVSEASHVDSRNTGRGAVVGEVVRIANVYMHDNLTEEKSKLAQYDQLSLMLSDVEAIFYETEDSGFSADLDRYFQAIEDLRSNPSSEIYKNNLENAGEIIVDDLKTLYSDIEEREVVAANTLLNNVDEVNSILSDIGEINYQILITTGSTNDLLDRRDQLEQKLAEYVDIDIDRSINYELTIGGTTAVRFETNIHDASVVSEQTAQKDAYSNDGYTSSLIKATWGAGDSVTYRLNNDDDTTVTVTHGEVITGFGTVDEENVVTALVYKINNDEELSGIVTAYNGQYSLDNDGNKILTNDLDHPGYEGPTTGFDSADLDSDKYLMIEAVTAGDEGKFASRIVVEDDDVDAVEVDKSATMSDEGSDNVYLDVFGKDLTLKSGKLKSMFDNLDTDSGNNLFAQYKEKLDNLAGALSDLSQSYIQNSDDSYVYGITAVDVDDNRADRIDLGLFSGSSVSTLEFNSGVVSTLTQDDLDYLATIQWQTDIDIDGTGENLTSFSSYNQALRVQIADDKENIDFKKETQDAVTNSLQNTYDKLVKVDKDEEMMNLIKFQAAYEANAKMITMVNELLEIILGLRRM